MTPQSKSKIIGLLGPLFHPAHIPYLMMTDFRSWQSIPDWISSFRPDYSFLEKPMPWLPFVATKWLRTYLQPHMKVFEYGSGASTIYMAKLAGRLFTVEHDAAWHARVSTALTRHGIGNCVYQLREPSFDHEATFASSGRPASILIADPSEKENPGADFESYIAAIDEHPDHTFDLVLVDGRARLDCVKRALPKIKIGGYLMLDNANDLRLVDCLEFMHPYERTNLHGIAPGWPPARWTTCVWRVDRLTPQPAKKPKNAITARQSA
jgi:hypothetical protein